ncbi:MAG TPA: YggS family pyridoxal phosphate-dependent enzyme [Gemmatimonadaceae bacterium]
MPYSDLRDRVAETRERIAEAVQRGGHSQEVTIVAVTKTHGPEAVQAAWDVGIRDVGENRVQEALAKMPQVAAPVRWHLIGHLQRNKVKSLDRFELFHALDTSRLADAVDRFASDRGSSVDALLQVNPLGEQTKGGFDPSEVEREGARLADVKGIRVRGVMTMARLDADESELRATFAAARGARDTLSRLGHPATELSMGMSGDFEIAVEEGATLVRLGTVLFGPRE